MWKETLGNQGKNPEKQQTEPFLEFLQSWEEFAVPPILRALIIQRALGRVLRRPPLGSEAKLALEERLLCTYPSKLEKQTSKGAIWSPWLSDKLEHRPTLLRGIQLNPAFTNIKFLLFNIFDLLNVSWNHTVFSYKSIKLIFYARIWSIQKKFREIRCQNKYSVWYLFIFSIIHPTNHEWHYNQCFSITFFIMSA